MSSKPTTTTTKIPPFTLSAPPGTDIWRKPPTHNAFTASLYPSNPPTHPLSTFQRARLTFALPAAHLLRQYDQAGLLLHVTKPGQAEAFSGTGMESKWIKTGIEFYYGKPYVATVGCDAWADWSLTAMPEFTTTTDGNGGGGRPSATIEARREKDVLGKSLWIYWLLRDGEGKEVERRPLREINWLFADEEGWDVRVAGYVCRPTKEDGEEDGDGGELLEAEFAEGVEIEVLDG